MSKLDQVSKKAFSYLFHIVLSLLLIDWAVKLPGDVGGIGIYEIVFVLLGVVSLVRLYFEKGKILQNTVSVLRTSKWSIVALATYLLFGFVTLFYAQTPSYAMTKYIVVVQMLFFGMCLFYYIPAHKDGPDAALKKIYFNIGISAVVSALWALCKYLLFPSGKYAAIISPVDDYNQYSTILLIGWICAATYISRKPVSATKKNVLLAVFSGLLLPMVLVSGSRRSYVIAYVISAAMLLLAVYFTIKAFSKKCEKTTLRTTICTMLICVLCVTLTSKILTYTVDTLSRLPATGTVTPDDSPQHPSVDSPGSAQDRLNSESGLGKRKHIWAVAIQEIQKFDAVEFLIGKGASHSSDIYDDLANPAVKDIHESYGYSENCVAEKNWMNSHNLFLQDMLDGGLLLLLAQLSMIFAAVFYTLRIIRLNPINGIALLLMYGILLVTLFLSPARGMLSNKFLWIITMLQTSECYILKPTNKS